MQANVEGLFSLVCACMAVIWAHNYLSITMENMLTILMVTKISLLLVNN